MPGYLLKMTSHIIWIHLLYLVCLSSACKVSWKLFDPKNDEFGGMVAFKNVTTPGKHKTYGWAWASNSESWENKITHRDINDIIEGSLTYRNTSHGEKTHVHISWKLIGDEFTSVNSKKKIYNNKWVISTIDGINMAFTADTLGAWEFTVLDDYKMSNSEDTTLGPVVSEETHMERKKRSEYEDETNITIQQAGVMDCIHDFLFGEGDPVTGEGEGIFTKVKNWVKDIGCKIRGTCGGDVPSMIPPVTIPPFNPNAEEIPANGGGNDVF